MPIAAVFLFGSLARADNSEGSDTDLLMITADADIRHVSAGHLSMFMYPWSRLKLDAKHGDLFVCHLVREAKAVFDPDDYLLKLREMFQLRADYHREIAQATDFGWFLAKFGSELNSALLAKRALWCIRTILIARSAMTGDPVFAPQLLSERTQSMAGRKLLNNRHNQCANEDIRQCLRLFLEEETPPDTLFQHADRATFINHFAQTSNKIALKTLEQEEQSQAEYM